MLKWVWLPSQATLMIVWLINVYLSSVYIFNYAYMIYIYIYIDIYTTAEIYKSKIIAG